jgi:hypothetical protein
VKEDMAFVGIAFLLTVVVFAGFVNPVFALTDEKHKWSTDGTAYAAVTGKYYNIGSPYYNQGHWGEITEGNVWRYAFTRFTQLNQTNGIVFQSEKFYLQNHTYKSESYTHDGVYYIITYTDSGYGTIPQSSVTVEIGPPGAQ